MNEEKKDMFYDLLAKKAIHGLDEDEQRTLDELDAASANRELRSLEMTAAAINLAGIEADEPLPEHLYSKIAADAVRYVGTPEAEKEATPWPPTIGREMFAEKPRNSFFGWLGWAAAAAACLALVVNIWLTRIAPQEIAKLPPTPVPSPRPLTPQEQFAAFESSTPNLVHATWAPGNVKDMKDVTGEVVWSDEKQMGYIRIRGLAVRTAPEFCYQLWIFDKVQDKATPIDGGIFDVNAEGEMIVPITARIKPEGPTMFALTIERHGGVVVSKRDKLAAIAKVETQSS
jgi:Anti-sigma-K factor rskA